MPPQWWAYWPELVLAVTLVMASYTDVRYFKIPNWITYPAVLAGLIGHGVMGGLSGHGTAELGLADSAVGLAVGFIPLFLVAVIGRGHGIGGGDCKLMGAVGALAGWRFALAAMLYGFIAAAVIAVIVMVAKRVTRRTLSRVWRFVVLLFVPGGLTDPATADSPKIPFGLALCIGAGISLVEVLLHGPVAKRFLLGW
jgi:prepilin peptidase CpaA